MEGAEWAEAQVDTIRLKLFKVGAMVRINARRVWLEMNAICPWKQIYSQTFDILRCWDAKRHPKQTFPLLPHKDAGEAMARIQRRPPSIS